MELTPEQIAEKIIVECPGWPNHFTIAKMIREYGEQQRKEAIKEVLEEIKKLNQLENGTNKRT